MSKVFCEPELLDSNVATGRWMVTIYNNEVNTFDEVIEILMRSTGCSSEEAYMETWETHHFGKAAVHFSMRDECEVIAAMIGTIGIRTVVQREWDN